MIDVQSNVVLTLLLGAVLGLVAIPFLPPRGTRQFHWGWGVLIFLGLVAGPPAAVEFGCIPGRRINDAMGPAATQKKQAPDSVPDTE